MELKAFRTQHSVMQQNPLRIGRDIGTRREYNVAFDGTMHTIPPSEEKARADDILFESPIKWHTVGWEGGHNTVVMGCNG